MDYSDTKSAIEWLRCYAAMLESGRAVLKANSLEITTDAIDMTTCDDSCRVFKTLDSLHTLTIKVRVQQ